MFCWNINIETSISGGGNYSLVVPASGNGLNVSIYPDDFVYDRKIYVTVDPPVTTTERTVYSAFSFDLNVISGKTYYKDISYSY